MTGQELKLHGVWFAVDVAFGFPLSTFPFLARRFLRTDRSGPGRAGVARRNRRVPGDWLRVDGVDANPFAGRTRVLARGLRKPNSESRRCQKFRIGKNDVFGNDVRMKAPGLEPGTYGLKVRKPALRDTKGFGPFSKLAIWK